MYNRALQSFGQQQTSLDRKEQAMAVLEGILSVYPWFNERHDAGDNKDEPPPVPNFAYFVQRRRDARDRHMRNE